MQSGAVLCVGLRVVRAATIPGSSHQRLQLRNKRSNGGSRGAAILLNHVLLERDALRLDVGVPPRRVRLLVQPHVVQAVLLHSLRPTTNANATQACACQPHHTPQHKPEAHVALDGGECRRTCTSNFSASSVGARYKPSGQKLWSSHPARKVNLPLMSGRVTGSPPVVPCGQHTTPCTTTVQPHTGHTIRNHSTTSRVSSRFRPACLCCRRCTQRVHPPGLRTRGTCWQ